MGLDPMLQQRSITQVVVTLTKDVLELLEQLIKPAAAGAGRGTLVVGVGKG